ncbi:MAG: PAN domain-containing protein, partial [Pseudomonadota bacterium]
PYRTERGTTAEACAHMCSSDGNCASWTLTAATFQIGPRCELKQTPGTTSYRPGAVSGLSQSLQMDPGRDAVMRYQVAVPASRQPEAVPLEELRPSPTPRTFGEPLEMSETELLGERQPRIIAEMVAEEAPVATRAVNTTPAPQVTASPSTAPAPSAKPETLAESVDTPAPAEAPMELAAPAPTTFTDPAQMAAVEAPAPAPAPAPVLVDAVTKLPAPPAPQAAAAPDQPVTTVNAVLKRPAPTTPAPLPAAAVPVVEPVEAPAGGAPISFRTPWTERQANDPDYSVEESDYIPGDEDATAGLIIPGS